MTRAMGRDDVVGPDRTGDRLLRFIEGASQLTIVAPFVKREPLRRLIDAVDTDAHVVVCTRWRIDEIASGVSDLSVLDEVRERAAGHVLLHPQLHAKAYIADGRALVGSSNTSGTGLGWSAVPAIELLTEIDVRATELVALMERLEVASTVATPQLQSFIAAQVAALSPSSDVVQPPPIATAGSLAAPELPDRKTTDLWLPEYQVPSVIWSAYDGRETPEIRALVVPDLVALGIRDGIREEAVFRAAVAVGLVQGFSGRIIHECSKDTHPVDAADRLRRLCDLAGVEVGALGRRWATLVRWVREFLPDYARLRQSVAQHWT